MLVESLRQDGQTIRHMRFPGTWTRNLRQPEHLVYVGVNRDVLRDNLSDLALDRSTPIGQMINNYLTGESEQEDHVIHLLFSANRWELA